MRDQDEPSSSTGSIVWTIVFGIVFAVMLERASGLLVGAALGYGLAQIFHLRSQVRRLGARLRLLETARKSKAPDSAPASIPAPAEVAPSAAEIELQTAFQPEPRTEPRIEPDPIFEDQPQSTPAAEPKPSTPGVMDSLLNAAMAWLKRGNPLARAGIVVLFFGGAFLAKYAAERSMFPIELRFLGIAAVALTLLVLGWRWRETRSVYAQTLQGGGVAGLYLTVFAATRLYQLLPPSLALGLMVVVAVASGLLAAAQNALALAVIGTAGGFMAPILVSTGSSNHIALFSYYAALNLGIFTVAWFRAWRVLNLLGFVFTFGIAGAFRAMAYSPEKMLSTDFFVWLFFLMYVAISVLFSLRQKPDLKGYVSASLVFGLPLAAFGIHGTLVSDIEYAMAWSALALGAFYVLLAWALYAGRRETLKLLSEAFAALGVIFASLAVPLAFDAQVTAATWAVEGAGLLWIGSRQLRRLAVAFGALLQLFGGFGYLLGAAHLQVSTPWLNSAFVGSLMLAVAGLLSGWWLQRGAEPSQDKSLSTPATFWAMLWWLGGGLAEIHRNFSEEIPALAMMFYTASAVLWHLCGRQLSWRLPQQLALAVTTLGTLFGVGVVQELHHPFAGLAAISWPLLLLIHYLLLRHEDRMPEHAAARGWIHTAGVWLLALLFAAELEWQIGQQVDGVWRHLGWGLVPAGMLWLLQRESLRKYWPMAAHEDAYRRAAPVLAAATLAWVLLMNLGSNGDAGPLIFVPLLNPLDISTGLALMVVVSWWLRLEPERRAILWPAPASTRAAALAALVFFWLNAALIRSLHYLAGTPLSLPGIAHSTVVQAALSIFWGLLGFSAMVLAARRARREVWIVGAGLMCVVVGKLFLVDLSGSGTLARIISFLVTGGLLLVTGYVSPLPPRKEAPAT